MISRWTGTTYRYKDLSGHWHCFRDEVKAKNSYKKFLHENDLYHGSWFGDIGKYEPLYCYEYGVKKYRIDI